MKPSIPMHAYPEVSQNEFSGTYSKEKVQMVGVIYLYACIDSAIPSQ